MVNKKDLKDYTKFIAIWLICITISIYTMKEFKGSLVVRDIAFITVLAPFTALIGISACFIKYHDTCIVGCK